MAAAWWWPTARLRASIARSSCAAGSSWCRTTAPTAPTSRSTTRSRCSSRETTWRCAGSAGSASATCATQARTWCSFPAASPMKATVLFADVSGTAISQCIEQLRTAAESTGGRVVKLIGDEVMVLFATPDAAAKAAVKMHQCIEALPAVEGAGLRVALTGKSETIRLCEMLKTSVNGAARAQEARARTMVRLTYDDQVVVCSRG